MSGGWQAQKSSRCRRPDAGPGAVRRRGRRDPAAPRAELMSKTALTAESPLARLPDLQLSGSEPGTGLAADPAPRQAGDPRFAGRCGGLGNAGPDTPAKPDRGACQARTGQDRRGFRGQPDGQGDGAGLCQRGGKTPAGTPETPAAQGGHAPGKAGDGIAALTRGAGPTLVRPPPRSRCLRQAWSASHRRLLPAAGSRPASLQCRRGPAPWHRPASRRSA